MTITTRDMSGRHEAHLVRVLSGFHARLTRGSGCTSRDPGDGRTGHLAGTFAFAWDAKCTLGRSQSISRTMWQKIREQAHWARPMLAFGFWDSERLQRLEPSLLAVGEDDFVEMWEAAEAGARVRAWVARMPADEQTVSLADLRAILDGS